MARQEKTIQNYQEKLSEKGIDNIPDFIQSILNADVTKGKYSRFLLDCYINDKFRIEDLQGGLDSTIGQAISLFHKHKGKLSEDMRSIYKYDSPGDLWQAVKQFEGQLSGKEIKRGEQDRIYAETEFLYEDKETGFKIVSPLTVESAKWWGKGTRWCTSADHNNQFKRYAEQSPLLIILMPDGNKLQLWKSNYDIQFMDEADNSVSLDCIEQNWNVLEPVIKWLEDIQFIPEEMRTEEICKIAVQNNGGALQYISDDYRTEELCKLAVQNNGWTLKYVPEKWKTEELYKLVIQQNGMLLENIPDKYKTKEMYLLAIQQNGLALEYLPEDMITEEICKIAIKSNGNALKFVPKDLKIKELCNLSIQQNGNALQYVPEHLKTEELCKIAVQNNEKSLGYVPYDMRTEELCKIVIQQNGGVLNCVPVQIRTEELCKMAVQQSGYALEYVPEHLKTEEICKMAVEQNGWVFKYVPDYMRTEELCRLAVQKDGLAIRYVPQDIKTEELCLLAFQNSELNSELAWSYIPDNIKKKIKKNIFQDITLAIIPEEKYQQVFSEIRSFFPEKTLSLTI